MARNILLAVGGLCIAVLGYVYGYHQASTDYNDFIEESEVRYAARIKLADAFKQITQLSSFVEMLDEAEPSETVLNYLNTLKVLGLSEIEQYRKTRDSRNLDPDFRESFRTFDDKLSEYERIFSE